MIDPFSAGRPKSMRVRVPEVEPVSLITQSSTFSVTDADEVYVEFLRDITRDIWRGNPGPVGVPGPGGPGPADLDDLDAELSRLSTLIDAETTPDRKSFLCGAYQALNWARDPRGFGAVSGSCKNSGQ